MTKLSTNSSLSPPCFPHVLTQVSPPLIKFWRGPQWHSTPCSQNLWETLLTRCIWNVCDGFMQIITSIWTSFSVTCSMQFFGFSANNLSTSLWIASLWEFSKLLATGSTMLMFFFPVTLSNMYQNCLLSQVVFKYSEMNAFSCFFASNNSWSAFLLDFSFLWFPGVPLYIYVFLVSLCSL